MRMANTAIILICAAIVLWFFVGFAAGSAIQEWLIIAAAAFQGLSAIVIVAGIFTRLDKRKGPDA